MAYDQEFFLALAAKGKDAWNAWQRDPANKDARVTFEAVDFSEAPKDRIDFSGFGFGHHANFSKRTWRGAEWRESEDNRETFISAALASPARPLGTAPDSTARPSGTGPTSQA
jgi:hypothetical protein